MSKLNINRRDLLVKSLGGAAGLACLPFLEAFHTKAYASPMDRPRRLVIFFHDAGIMPGEFVPTTTGAHYAPSPMLAPLAAHLPDLAVVSGLKHEARWLSPGNNHREAKTSLLTGVGAYPGPGDENWANGPSVDQVLARRMPLTPRRTIDVIAGNHRVWYENVVSFASANQPVTSRYHDPLDLYNSLFGPSDPQGQRNRESRNSGRLAALDAARRNFALYRKGLGREDRIRLDAHESNVRDIELRLEAGMSRDCAAPMVPRTEGLDLVHDIGSAFRAQVDIVVQALACDMSRVAVLYPHTQQCNRFGDIPVPGGVWHGFLHTLDDHVVTKEPGLRRQFFLWQYEQLAYLLDRMKSIDEGDGNLLDNSLVLSISEFGNAATHDKGLDGPNNVERLPVLLAGRLGGDFVPGRHIACKNRNHNDLLTTILNLFGSEDQTFGERSLCRGPIGELLDT